MEDQNRPVFLQLSERLENEIISGQLQEDQQIPSINELASFYRINPATALRAVTMLVDEGVLYKKRGIGMFVSDGAKKTLVEKHLTQFNESFIRPLLTEAKKLDLTEEKIIKMLRKESK